MVKYFCDVCGVEMGGNTSGRYGYEDYLLDIAVYKNQSRKLVCAECVVKLVNDAIGEPE